MRIVSLFSGCGGLDLGFKNAGFDIVWANDNAKSVWQTYEANHPETQFDKRSLLNIPSNQIPNCVGIIGGPPCQSWSSAGSRKGISDSRGRLFHEYIRVLRDKQPLFFLAENVSGMLHRQHSDALAEIIRELSVGYNVSYKLLNAGDYGVPQDRERVIFVGFHQDTQIQFDFNDLQRSESVVLRDAIADLPDPIPSPNNKATGADMNHEYFTGGFSSIYMSRNRVRGWSDRSFTIQASGRHAPLHPQAKPMVKVGKDEFIFHPDSPSCRRLSIRECARIQTFPDSFSFEYDNLNDGYKAVGNAVPVTFAQTLASSIAVKLAALNINF
jgi:DNA (cytosine-5)-methyltransferase 1